MNMYKPSKLMLLVAVIASTANPVMAVQPNDANSAASSLYSERLKELLDTTGWHFESAVDTKQIVKEFRANQARAQIQFGKPGIYRGRISKVVADNLGTYFILDQGLDTAVTVILARNQAWPWKTVNANAEVGGIQSALEFAANFKTNQLMYFQCRKVEFGLGVYLTNCLAFPPAVALTRSAPDLKNSIDAAENFDDLIKARASEGWVRPTSIPSNIAVTLQIKLSVGGVFTSINIAKSSGDKSYDNSVVAAIQNIGVLSEVEDMNPEESVKYRSFKMTFTPDDLAL
ncbi:TonB C-terminal domain-containing protein [Pseudomonas moraviensis]|uniref:TonB C-terminal domain-containing protein n=1 Tax=Pseudomonas moraviensis TaxID=321662 RepID=UPI0018DA05C7|nr:TonB C-terminal domain-containing protein [Pseudomonas moraviensis]MBH3442231.1 TonB C-terminal domain-containing protein [Pseudomonas moraviensis]